MIRIAILGGGFIGQLLKLAVDANYVKSPRAMRPARATVYDWRPAAPAGGKGPVQTRMFGPQYLWEPLAGWPARSFPVVTTVDGMVEGMVGFDHAVRAYKRKIGRPETDRKAGQFAHETLGYEATLPDVPVRFGYTPLRINTSAKVIEFVGKDPVSYDILLSTIPLPALARLTTVVVLRDGADLLHARPIYVTVSSPVDLPVAPGLQVNYLSDPDSPVYRQTMRDGAVHTESMEPMPDARKLVPGKIYSDGRGVRTDMLDLLAQRDVFCFGRFATWNDDELAHETYKEFTTWLTTRGL